MEDRPRKLATQQQELHEKRKELHGKRRKLHERLSEVCEDFVLGDLTGEHKRSAGTDCKGMATLL